MTLKNWIILLALIYAIVCVERILYKLPHQKYGNVQQIEEKQRLDSVLHVIELKEKDYEIKALENIIVLHGNDSIKSDSIYAEFRNKFRDRQRKSK